MNKALNLSIANLIKGPLPSVSPAVTGEERTALRERIKRLLKARDAVVVAHYYVHEDIQQLAEETGGIVSDSLEMARFGHRHSAKTLVVAGVRFMGETAKILNPEKRIIMPTFEAECSLDLGCPADAFIRYCNQHLDRTVVVYANTSAAVKARADWVVTSSIAVKVIEHLKAQGKKILWAPDKHLGRYILSVTQADMLLWDSACVVHEAFKAHALKLMKRDYPEAAILAHPESPLQVLALADVVGSTSQLIQAARDLPHETLIVATDNGIFYKMQQVVPHKRLLEAPIVGRGATCLSCAHCPWMAMNGLRNLSHVLESGSNEVYVDEAIRTKALISTQRMLDFVGSS